ncbi:hypothetical protein Unana1_00316 [Umbelopsis nana]
MTDTDHGPKPIRYRFTSHNSQPVKRRKIRAARNAPKQTSDTRNSTRDPTPSTSTQTRSSSGSHSTAPLRDCALFFALRSDDEQMVMSRVRSLGATIAQSDGESTHVVLHAPHPSKKQLQQMLGWKEQGKWVVSLTWVNACMSTWSRQPEFNHPPGRGDQSLVTGSAHTHKVSSNPFNHDLPPLVPQPGEGEQLSGPSDSVAAVEFNTTLSLEMETPSGSNDSSLCTLEALAARYAKSIPPPPEQTKASTSTKAPALIQQKIRHAMAPSSTDPNIKIWTEEKMTPEALMEKHRSATSRRKSLRLGHSKK